MSKKNRLNRRNFIKTSAAGMLAGGLLSQTPILANEDKTTEGLAKIKSYRKLGRTGFKVSDIGSGGVTPVEVLNALLDAGVNYIDTAESYGRGQSEKNVGEAIQGRDRKKLFITTKLAFNAKKPQTKEKIIERFEACRKRMQTEYIDCLMIHSAATPEALKNPAFHAAAAELKKGGKLRFVGVSNHGGQYAKVPAAIRTSSMVAGTLAY